VRVSCSKWGRADRLGNLQSGSPRAASPVQDEDGDSEMTGELLPDLYTSAEAKRRSLLRRRITGFNGALSGSRLLSRTLTVGSSNLQEGDALTLLLYRYPNTPRFAIRLLCSISRLRGFGASVQLSNAESYLKQLLRIPFGCSKHSHSKPTDFATLGGAAYCRPRSVLNGAFKGVSI
jgi:hypothetical protein